MNLNNEMRTGMILEKISMHLYHGLFNDVCGSALNGALMALRSAKPLVAALREVISGKYLLRPKIVSTYPFLVHALYFPPYRPVFEEIAENNP